MDWGKDVSQFLNARQLEKVDVIGVSGGAPYALACCDQIREHVHHAIVVSGLGQLNSDEQLNLISAEEC